MSFIFKSNKLLHEDGDSFVILLSWIYHQYRVYPLIIQLPLYLMPQYQIKTYRDFNQENR